MRTNKHLKKRCFKIYIDMSKYNNGKIYKIVDNAYTKQYIGSTTEKLSQRMLRHRSDYRRYLDSRKLHKKSTFDLFEEFGIDNCKIELIEYCKCDSKDELVRREGELIKNSDCVNKTIAGRTKKSINKTTENKSWNKSVNMENKNTHVRYVI